MDPDVAPHPTAAWLCWGIERGLAEVGRADGGQDPERWLTALTDLIWNTLYRNVR